MDPAALLRSPHPLPPPVSQRTTRPPLEAIERAQEQAAAAIWHDKLVRLSDKLSDDEGLPTRFSSTRLTLPVDDQSPHIGASYEHNPLADIARRRLTTGMLQWAQALCPPFKPSKSSCLGDLHFIANAAGSSVIERSLRGELSHADVAMFAAQELSYACSTKPIDRAERKKRYQLVERLRQKYSLPNDLSVVLHLRAQMVGDISLEMVRHRLRNAEEHAKHLRTDSSATRSILADLALSSAEKSCTVERGWEVFAPIFVHACESGETPGTYVRTWYRSPLSSLAEVLIHDRDDQDAFFDDIACIDAERGEPIYVALAIAWLHRMEPEIREQVLQGARAEGLCTSMNENQFFALVRLHADALFQQAISLVPKDKVRGVVLGPLALLAEREVQNARHSLAAGEPDDVQNDPVRHEAARLILQADSAQRDRFGILMSHWRLRRGWTVVAASRQLSAIGALSDVWRGPDVFALVHLLDHGPIRRYPQAPKDALVQALEWATKTLSPNMLPHAAVVIDALFLYVPSAEGEQVVPPFEQQMHRLSLIALLCRDEASWESLSRCLTAALTQVGEVDDSTQLVDLLLPLSHGLRARLAVEMMGNANFPYSSGPSRIRWVEQWLQATDSAVFSSLDVLTVGAFYSSRNTAWRWHALTQRFACTEPAFVTLRALVDGIALEQIKRRHSTQGQLRPSDVSDEHLAWVHHQLSTLITEERGRTRKSLYRHPPWRLASHGDLVRMLAWSIGQGEARHALGNGNFLSLCLGATDRQTGGDDGARAWRHYALLWAYRIMTGGEASSLRLVPLPDAGEGIEASSPQSPLAPQDIVH